MNLEEISKFIDLVKNPDKYAAAIAEFEQRQASWKALVETQTSLEDADRYVAQKKTDAELHLAKAEQVLTDANANATLMKQQLQDQHNQVDQLKQEARKNWDDAQVAAQNAKEVEAQLIAQRDQLEKERAISDQRVADLNAKEADLNSRLEKLKALAS